MATTPRPYVKADKLGRIISITVGDQTPETFKETLNHFRGRQIKTNLKDCLEYLKLSIAAQEGDTEAAKEINRIHHTWNPRNFNYEN